MKFAIIVFAITASLTVLRARAAEPPMVVHEWGTFTCLQDETGRAIGAINSDDEPVPAFVHRAFLDVADSNHIALSGGKGLPILYPAVTMRLETPVMYFHLSIGASPMTVSVDVAFHGGWLTEFYPKAQSQTPGYEQLKDADGMHVSGLTGDVVGTLAWPKVEIGTGANLPIVQDKVWTTPRLVRTAPVSAEGESEDFLFYRGVGHLDAPLRVSRTGLGDQIQIALKKGLDKSMRAEFSHAPMWLVRVGPTGWVDWNRGYSPADGESKSVLGVMDAGFQKDAIHSIGLASLHKDMASFLVKAGLFPDEAEAMLNTWTLSYFKSPGTRLFFLVPQKWTDATLPLHISGSPQITRVMIGRIEIVTPEQRSLIREIESPSPSVPVTADQASAARQLLQQALATGDGLAHAEAALSPADSAYVGLGRFRDAILIDEQAQRPNQALTEFMAQHLVGRNP
jgi:hypothetical protein